MELIHQATRPIPLDHPRIARHVARRRRMHGDHEMEAHLITNSYAIESPDGTPAGVIVKEIPWLSGVVHHG